MNTYNPIPCGPTAYRNAVYHQDSPLAVQERLAAILVERYAHAPHESGGAPTEEVLPRQTCPKTDTRHVNFRAYDLSNAGFLDFDKRPKFGMWKEALVIPAYFDRSTPPSSEPRTVLSSALFKKNALDLAVSGRIGWFELAVLFAAAHHARLEDLLLPSTEVVAAVTGDVSSLRVTQATRSLEEEHVVARDPHGDGLRFEPNLFHGEVSW